MKYLSLHVLSIYLLLNLVSGSDAQLLVYFLNALRDAFQNEQSPNIARSLSNIDVDPSFINPNLKRPMSKGDMPEAKIPTAWIETDLYNQLAKKPKVPVDTFDTGVHQITGPSSFTQRNKLIRTAAAARKKAESPFRREPKPAQEPEPEFSAKAESDSKVVVVRRPTFQKSIDELPFRIVSNNKRTLETANKKLGTELPKERPEFGRLIIPKSRFEQLTRKGISPNANRPSLSNKPQPEPSAKVQSAPEPEPKSIKLGKFSKKVFKPTGGAVTQAPPDLTPPKPRRPLRRRPTNNRQRGLPQQQLLYRQQNERRRQVAHAARQLLHSVKQQRQFQRPKQGFRPQFTTQKLGQPVGRSVNPRLLGGVDPRVSVAAYQTGQLQQQQRHQLQQRQRQQQFLAQRQGNQQRQPGTQGGVPQPQQRRRLTPQQQQELQLQRQRQAQYRQHLQFKQQQLRLQQQRKQQQYRVQQQQKQQQQQQQQRQLQQHHQQQQAQGNKQSGKPVTLNASLPKIQIHKTPENEVKS